MQAMTQVQAEETQGQPSIRLLGELLVEAGIVSASDVQKALAFQ